MKTKMWLLLGVLSVAAVTTIVATTVVLLTQSSEQKAKEEPTLSREDIVQKRMKPNHFNGTWISGKELLYTDSSGNVVIYTFGSNSSKRILLSAEKLKTKWSSCEISADNQYLKLESKIQKIYRHSYKAKYTIVSLRDPTNRISLQVANKYDFFLAVWAPVGNALACVYENNIYYKPNMTVKDFTQITSNADFIYNGIPDWIYEEEVYASNKALWFSPDGTKLAYGKFDDQKVTLMQLPTYGQPGSLQYPSFNGFKYPKAGTTNPTVSLHCVDLTNITKNEQLTAPTTLQQPILSVVSWATNNTVLAIWMNRIQNQAFIVTYLITQTSYTMETIQEMQEKSGWLDLFTAPLFSADGSQMVLILPREQDKNVGAYRHIVRLSLIKNAQGAPLTKGAFVVTKILAWNHNFNKIFYLANTEADSAAQHVYSVSVDTKAVECLSCGIKSKNNLVNCAYNVAKFSKDASHYILTCAGPDIPDTSVHSLEKKLLEWDHNKKLQSLAKSKRLPTTKIMSFNIEGGFKAQVLLRLPQDLDTSGKTKYPMLVKVYAGPGASLVAKQFNIDWESYLVANKSIIYATIDARGSGLKSNEQLFASYRRLGTVEISDQIHVTKQIQDTLPYVDHSRTAVWGWSYGGYATGMILANDKDRVFKCGISVAPVTDWALYDSIYTERYMGLPTTEDNYQGYRNANLLLKYEGLRNKQYFLIHGTYDDNVHYQQSMLWTKVLEQHDILFRQLSYPDENHDLSKLKQHLYHSMEDFLEECFGTKKHN